LVKSQSRSYFWWHDVWRRNCVATEMFILDRAADLFFGLLTSEHRYWEWRATGFWLNAGGVCNELKTINMYLIGIGWFLVPPLLETKLDSYHQIISRTITSAPGNCCMNIKKLYSARVLELVSNTLGSLVVSITPLLVGSRCPILFVGLSAWRMSAMRVW